MTRKARTVTDLTIASVARAQRTADALPGMTMDQIIADIARAKLNLDTLETRNSDGLDFSDQAVWSIKAALEAAYAAGLAKGRK